jgi:TRAP-type uncharacterized transport system fused permease subunit
MMKRSNTDWENIALPIILILTGLVLLGAGLAGWLSLDRIQNLWPAAIILIGLAELLPQHNDRSRIERNR